MIRLPSTVFVLYTLSVIWLLMYAFTRDSYCMTNSVVFLTGGLVVNSLRGR